MALVSACNAEALEDLSEITRRESLLAQARLVAIRIHQASGDHARRLEEYDGLLQETVDAGWRHDLRENRDRLAAELLGAAR